MPRASTADAPRSTGKGCFPYRDDFPQLPLRPVVYPELARSRPREPNNQSFDMKTMLTAVALAALVLPIQAKEKKEGGKKGPNIEKMFSKKDTDGDGFLSKDEFTKGAKDAERAGKAFDRMDKDGDGKLSKEEMSQRGKGGKGGKGGKKKNKGGEG